jgi:stage II sporulation protein D
LNDKVNRQRILTRLERHPWMLILMLALAPLVGIGCIAAMRQTSSSQTASTAKVIPTPVVPSPSATPFYLQTASLQKPQTPPTQPTQKPKSTIATQAKKQPTQQAAVQAAAKTPVRNRPAPVPVTSSTVDAYVEMRVAISEGASTLTIGTSTTGEVLDGNRQRLLNLSASSASRVYSDGNILHFDGKPAANAVWIEPTQSGYVYVNDRWYRGRLLLVAQGSQLLAVNFVNMRDYLYSVVGSEMPPSWAMDALKAQAVAARSYALTYYFRPAHSLYHIGNTESYQVYRGIETETNTTHYAVNSTGGEFLSYQGGIVESLYAASDDIVMEAHGGRGMSQTGAMKLAEQGHDYRQILGTYYPGVGLARFEVDRE